MPRFPCVCEGLTGNTGGAERVGIHRVYYIVNDQGGAALTKIAGCMEPGPTVFMIPRHLENRSRHLRWAVLAHALLEPAAIWTPVLAGARGRWIVLIGVPILLGLYALLQAPALGAPRTMRRRYRRITGQAGIAVAGIFAFQAVIMVLFGRLTWLVFGTLLFAVPLLFLLLVSAPVYVAPRQEDVSRGVS